MEKNELTIKFSDIFKVVQRCWYLLLAVFILFGAFAYVYSNLTYREQYTAVSDFFIIKQSSSGNYGTGDYNIDLALTKDIISLIKTPKVLDAVIEKIEQERDTTGFSETLSRKKLLKSIRVTNQADTRMIIIENTASTKKDAKIISEALCIVAKEKIDLVLDADRVSINDIGVVGDEPSNSKYSITMILLPFLAVFVLYAVFFVIYILDDKIKSLEDAERYLGVSVLGLIPNVGDNGKIKDKYMNHYYSYGHISHDYSAFAENKEESGEENNK